MSWFQPAAPLLPDLIRLNANWRSRDLALCFEEKALTWRELQQVLDRVAGMYAGLGLEPGDRVALLMQNSIDMFTAMFGAVCGGYVAVPLNTSVADAGIAMQIRDCAAQAVVASEDHIPRLETMREGFPGDLRERMIATADAHAGWLHFASLVAAADGAPVAARIAGDDACNIIYSSGTTGMPKGIVHSHACRMAWAYDMSVALHYHANVRTLVSLGLYSNISWVTMLSTMLVGGTLHIVRSFEVRACLELVARERITHSGMVPVQLQRILDSPEFDTHDLASLQSLMCCGSPLHVDLKMRILERIPGDFMELYGLTEGLVTTQSPADAARYPAAVGKPCPGQHLRILDANDQPLPPGEAGEIVGYGRLLMSGYLNRDRESEQATWVDELGRRWLRTGDVGRVDEHGNLYLVDRKKDMIISGGQNVYPSDIESVIAMHPDVSDVAVIGIRSERWGETPLAVVCGTGIDRDGLLCWINERVGRQQRVAAVCVVDELPRNPNGKVLKRELRTRFADFRQDTGAA